jgi:hypothetical protein
MSSAEYEAHPSSLVNGDGSVAPVDSKNASRPKSTYSIPVDLHGLSWPCISHVEED